MATFTRSGFGRTKARQSVAPAEPAAGPGFRVAAVQMASGPSVAGNLEEAARLIEMAVAQGARLVALPEYFAIMGMKDTDKVELREREGDGPIQRFLSQTARRHRIWLIGASVPMESPSQGKIYNSCQVYDDDGRMVARYDKIHLFSLDLGKEKFAEERTIEPGTQVKVIDSPFGRIGLSVCYDLRFPELYRAIFYFVILLFRY